MTRHEMTCRAGTRLSNISDWICKLTPNQGTCEVILTVEQARKNLNWLLPPLLNQIHVGQYSAPPVRRVFIPKADGKQRPIGVPEILDRVIQAGASQILSDRLHNFYNETVCYWRYCLSRRSQRGSLNWAKLKEVLERHPLRGPRIKVTYQELLSYVRL